MCVCHSSVLYMYIYPSFLWLLIPAERLFMARLNTLHQRQSLQDADAKTHRHRFHSSLSNSNDLGESVQSMRREKKAECRPQRKTERRREKKNYKASSAIIMLREENVAAPSKKPNKMKR